MLLPYDFHDIMPYQLGGNKQVVLKIAILCGLVALVFAYFPFIVFWGCMFLALYPLLLIIIEAYAKESHAGLSQIAGALNLPSF